MATVLARFVLGAALLTAGWELTAAGSGQQYDEARAAWSVVLQRFVDERGRVDFDGLRAAPEKLSTYLECVAEYGPLSHPEDFESREARLAYYLNAYNALAMRKVIDFGIPASITGLTKLRFFGLSGIRVSGEDMSLYTFENSYIRAEGDPRIHFALNCMAVSCPRLPRRPFALEELDARLDGLAREFFSRQRHLRVSHSEELVRVSDILDFFAADFLAESSSLIQYINRYVEPDIPAHYDVEFMDYDWRVNARNP